MKVRRRIWWCERTTWKLFNSCKSYESENFDQWWAIQSI